MADSIDDDIHEPWFPDTKLGWSLDVVTLLAVIGEASMTEHSQAITASAFCLLPRILPAPQALLLANRPQRMPETKATVSGVKSGVALESISFFASIIVPLDLEPYAFMVYNIEHSDKIRAMANPPTGTGPTTLFGRLKGLFGGGGGGGGKAPEGVDVEAGDGQSVETAGSQTKLKKKLKNTLVSGGPKKRPAIPAQLTSPLHILTLLSFLTSLAIILCAIWWRDGTAILSVSLISLASSIVGYASWWEPQLMSVPGAKNRALPDGDIMIRTRAGAFIYVRCKEDVARELFSGTEVCRYHVQGKAHHLLMAAGTVILMLAVVLMGNCKWNSQIFIGGTYIVLNGLYWGVGMLPKTYFWDLSRYKVDNKPPDDAKDAHKDSEPSMTPAQPGSSEMSLAKRFNRTSSRVVTAVKGRPNRAEPEEPPQQPQPPLDPDSEACFTRTLWYAIRESKSSGWVTKSKAAPHTPVWDQWLAEAEAAAVGGNREWKAVARKNELFEEAQAKEAQAKKAREEVRSRGGVNI